MAATVTKTEHGNYTHGVPFCTTDRSWCRVDTYHSDRSPDLDGNRDRLFATGPEDDSPIYSGRYDSVCSCCYLHFAHTTDYHNRSTSHAK